jgi:uncharacterized protein YkwD
VWVQIVAGAWVILVVLVLASCRAAARADEQDERLARRLIDTGRRGSTVGLVTAASALAVPSSGQARACAAPDSGASPAVTETAIVCRVEAIRSDRGLQRLRMAKRLSRAAGSYAEDMAERDFFSHISPEGERLRDRVLRAHWVNEQCAWHVGEVLAWGSGDHATAAWTVRAWMRSADHRRLLVGADFDSIGVGVAAGAPVAIADGTPAITVSALLGTRDCPS